MKDEDVKTLLQEMEWVRKHHTTDCWLAQAEKLRKRNLRMALFNHFENLQLAQHFKLFQDLVSLLLRHLVLRCISELGGHLLWQTFRHHPTDRRFAHAEGRRQMLLLGE